MFEELFCSCGCDYFKVSRNGKYLLCCNCGIIWNIEELVNEFKERTG